VVGVVQEDMSGTELGARINPTTLASTPDLLAGIFTTPAQGSGQLPHDQEQDGKALAFPFSSSETKPNESDGATALTAHGLHATLSQTQETNREATNSTAHTNIGSIEGENVTASPNEDPFHTPMPSVRIWAGTWNMGAKEFPKSMEEELRVFVPIGYDLYALGVQEGISDAFVEAVEAHLKAVHVVRLPVTPQVFGRGDGSFIFAKHTGLVLFCRRHLLPATQIVAEAAVSLGFTEGSKGGAAVVLHLAGTTIAFVSCHLPANSLDGRRDAFKYLVNQLGEALGDPSFSLTLQFHHVIWMGDLNYRMHDITIDRVMELIEQQGQDSMQQATSGSREPPSNPEDTLSEPPSTTDGSLPVSAASSPSSHSVSSSASSSYIRSPPPTITGIGISEAKGCQAHEFKNEGTAQADQDILNRSEAPFASSNNNTNAMASNSNGDASGLDRLRAASMDLPQTESTNLFRQPSLTISAMPPCLTSAYSTTGTDLVSHLNRHPLAGLDLTLQPDPLQQIDPSVVLPSEPIVEGLALVEHDALSNKRGLELLREYDELRRDQREAKAFYGFSEARMMDDFYPSYKRKEGRERPVWSDPASVQAQYRTLYKEPWYKSGRTSYRIPAYTDRILFQSHPNLRQYLQPESLGAISRNSEGSILVHNYTCVNDYMTLSDHAPVFCTFILQLPHVSLGFEFRRLTMAAASSLSRQSSRTQEQVPESQLAPGGSVAGTTASNGTQAPAIPMPLNHVLPSPQSVSLCNSPVLVFLARITSLFIIRSYYRQPQPLTPTPSATLPDPSAVKHAAFAPMYARVMFPGPYEHHPPMQPMPKQSFLDEDEGEDRIYAHRGFRLRAEEEDEAVMRRHRVQSAERSDGDLPDEGPGEGVDKEMTLAFKRQATLSEVSEYDDSNSNPAEEDESKPSTALLCNSKLINLASSTDVLLTFPCSHHTRVPFLHMLVKVKPYDDVTAHTTLHIDRSAFFGQGFQHNAFTERLYQNGVPVIDPESGLPIRIRIALETFAVTPDQLVSVRRALSNHPTDQQLYFSRRARPQHQ